MDEQTQGAVRLIAALHQAAQSFSTFGYNQYLAHQSIRWHRANTVGNGVDPLASVGVVFDLDNAEDAQVLFQRLDLAS